MGYVFGLIIMFLIGLWFVPIMFIWSLNVLFGLSIAYNFTTWLASLIVVGVLAARST